MFDVVTSQRYGVVGRACSVIKSFGAAEGTVPFVGIMVRKRVGECEFLFLEMFPNDSGTLFFCPVGICLESQQHPFIQRRGLFHHDPLLAKCGFQIRINPFGGERPHVYGHNGRFHIVAFGYVAQYVVIDACVTSPF